MPESSLGNSSTSASLIDRVKVQDMVAWERFNALYTPVVYGWARKANLQQDDAADIVQEVFQAVAKSINRFGSEGKPKRFRAWLWGITRFKLQDHFRRCMSQPQGADGTGVQLDLARMPEELPDSEQASEANSLTHRAMQLMKTDFQESTWQAFWRVTVEDQSPDDVAHDLGISVGSVYTAKSRVLAHLRRELEGLD